MAKREYPNRVGCVLSTVIFPDTHCVDAINKITKAYNCSRGDVIEVLLRHFYNDEKFAQELQTWKVEKASIREAHLESNRKASVEKKRIMRLLQDNPDLMEKLQASLDHV